MEVVLYLNGGNRIMAIGEVTFYRAFSSRQKQVAQPETPAESSSGCPAQPEEDTPWWQVAIDFFAPSSANTDDSNLQCGYYVGENAPPFPPDGEEDASDDTHIPENGESDADGDEYVPDDGGEDVIVPEDGGEDAVEDTIVPEDGGEDVIVPDEGEDGTDIDVGPTVCDNDPTSPNLESPTPDETGVSIQPLLNCSDSTDGDSAIGDSIHYRFRVFSDSSCTIAIRDWTEDISEHQVSSGDALDLNTDYWYNAEATDTCPTSVISTPDCIHFHTALPVTCNNDPGPFGLTHPADGVRGEPALPDFAWDPSPPVDAGDVITYTLIISTNSDCSSPIRTIPVGTATAKTLEPGQELPGGGPYYWQIIATDSCGRTRASAIRSFNVLLCTPHTYSDTDFTAGIASSNLVIVPDLTGGNKLILAKDESVWVCYDGSAYPETAGWTEDAPFGWIIKTTSGGILELSTIDANVSGTYRINIPFNSSMGWMFRAITQLVESQGGAACTMLIQDESFNINFRYWNDRIIENNVPGNYYLMDPRLAYNTYLFTEKEGNYGIFVNSVLRLSGTAPANPGTGSVQIHDPVGSYDCDMRYDELCWYIGGNTLPYVGSGPYNSEIIDTGTTNNNIGTGATIRWSQITPLGTSNSVIVCASNDPGMAGAICSGGLTNNLGETIPPSVLGRYLTHSPTLSTTNNLLTPQFQDVTIEYETCE